MSKKKTKSKKQRLSDNKLLILLLVLALLVALALSFYKKSLIHSKKYAPAPTPAPITADFTCDGEQTIKAIFSNEKVNLTLSDGREIELFQTVSADGARYANTDETIVFWNTGNTATLEENGEVTFDNCQTPPAE